MNIMATAEDLGHIMRRSYCCNDRSDATRNGFKKLCNQSPLQRAQKGDNRLPKKASIIEERIGLSAVRTAERFLRIRQKVAAQSITVIRFYTVMKRTGDQCLLPPIS